MSIKTWRDEFYTPAKKCAKKNALAHSLKKWQGLTHENLERHGLLAAHPGLVDSASGQEFDVSTDTCALCAKFYDEEDEDVGRCGICPLVQTVKGEVSRKEYSNLFFGCQRQFGDWIRDHNPRPMIRLIERTIKRLAEPEEQKAA